MILVHSSPDSIDAVLSIEDRESAASLFILPPLHLFASLRSNNLFMSFMNRWHRPTFMREEKPLFS